jgi:hypothetical protein
MHIEFLLDKLKGRDHLGELTVDGRKKLKCSRKTQETMEGLT